MIKQKILKVINNVRPDLGEFINSDNLIIDGIIDSLDIMNIVEALEKEFSIEIDPFDISAENFNNIDEILSLCRKYIKY